MIHIMPSPHESGFQARINPIRAGCLRLFWCLAGEPLANKVRRADLLFFLGNLGTPSTGRDQGSPARWHPHSLLPQQPWVRDGGRHDVNGLLLRQPGGFEGLRPIEVVVNPDDLAGPQCEDLCELDAYLSAAGRAAPALCQEGNHSVPAVE